MRKEHFWAVSLGSLCFPVPLVLQNKGRQTFLLKGQVENILGLWDSWYSFCFVLFLQLFKNVKPFLPQGFYLAYWPTTL